MAILIDNMQWVLLVCGLLTCSMIQAAFAPRATMRAYFGEAPDSPAADLVVRNWGVLIAAGGAMLIWAAFDPASRPLALSVVGATKLAFIVLTLASGAAGRTGQARISILIDTIMLVLFGAYLVATWAPAAA